MESPVDAATVSEPTPTVSEAPDKPPTPVIHIVDDERAPPARDGPLPVLEFIPTVPDLAFTQPRIVPILSRAPVPAGPHQEFVQIEDWVRQIHPSGRVYIYNSARRTVMAGDLGLVRDFADRQTRVDQLSFPAMDELWGGLRARLGDAFDADSFELFLKVDVLSDPEAPKVLYYFVEWSSRTVFWLHEFTFEFHPISTRWHQRDMLECQFWAHVDNFPMHHSLPPNSREELEAVLAYQTVEAKTFRESTAPWKPEDSHMLAKTLPSIDFTNPLGRAFSRRPSLGSSATLLTSGAPGQFIPPHEGASNATVARLWRLIYILRVQHFYGDEYARIGRTERRRPTSSNEPPRWLRRFLSFFLFGRPPRFYSELQDVFVDEIMHLTHWRNFVEEEVQPEWTNNGFMATVMLA
ncbi:hypothetical protein AURDEDRAFT_165477 [Auricularia subglabra TFB-10046 SS5]|nr:hypothetical protein AURDEDRAFT_165477 [Auricularia subglabra TFB-10046 SS5]